MGKTKKNKDRQSERAERTRQALELKVQRDKKQDVKK